MTTPFTSQDLDRFASMGTTPERVASQLELFRAGVQPTPLSRACTLGDGIVTCEPQQQDELLALFETARAAGRFSKFVPASGAATRMFKALHAARESLAKGVPPQSREVDEFHSNLDRFAFAEELCQQLAARGKNSTDLAAVLDVLLGEEAMNYGNKPKGLLSFHRYTDCVRTPVQEHLAETWAYVADSAGRGSLHFTVSPEHMTAFQAHVAAALPAFKAMGLHAEIGFSIQKQSTDTVAVTPDNAPFRDSAGQILFRPAGHGALIENLADLGGDLIFIKNIDNVVPDHLKQPTILAKKLLGGLVVQLQQRIFAYLERLTTQAPAPALIAEVADYARTHLGWNLPAHIQKPREAVDFLVAHLDRPLRVCGMVRNEGEPGGGPFWVHSGAGLDSLQIVESSQINTRDPEQATILASATHFNPVDLVCAVRDRHGRPFPLADYVDPAACFISEKSYEGRPLKALELPGLWNGAMAFWNTCFVEVPLTTFNPVKTINDLLRDQHQ